MYRLVISCAAIAGLALAAAPASAQNSELAQQVASSLKRSGYLKGFRVGVKVVDDTALLSGRVSSAKQKTMAEAIALQTPGVNEVINQLSVQPADSTLTAKPLAATRNVVTRAAHEELAETPPSAASRPTSVFSAPRPDRVASRVSMQTVAQPSPAAAHAEGSITYAQGAGPLPVQAGVYGGGAPIAYDNPHLPNYAWPSYAAYPNYAAVTYPRQHSASAWPYIGPFYPYPQVPLGWRKVTLEWDDGWWWLDFKGR